MSLNLNEETRKELLEILRNQLENEEREGALFNTFEEAWEYYYGLPQDFVPLPDALKAYVENMLICEEADDIRKRLKATRLFTQLLRKEIKVKQFMDEYIAIRNDEVDNYLDNFIPQHI